MKTIIGILVFLLMGLNLSGQTVTSAGIIEHTPYWEKTKHLPLENNEIQNLNDPNRRQQAYTIGERIYDLGFDKVAINYAHFKANGRLFMLSYEDKADRTATDVPEHLKNQEVLEAELYLYSIDLSKPKSDWEIASVEKIAGKYKPSPLLISVSRVGYSTDVDFYMYKPDKNTDIGKVIEHDDGSVEVIARVVARETGKGRTYDQHIKFVFTPVDAKHYTHKKIEIND